MTFAVTTDYGTQKANYNAWDTNTQGDNSIESTGNHFNLPWSWQFRTEIYVGNNKGNY